MAADPEFYFTAYYLSEGAITIQFGEKISAAVSDKVNNFNTLLLKNPFEGFITTVPAYTTLSIFYDPVAVSKNLFLTGGDCFEKVSGYLQLLSHKHITVSNAQSNAITIPVCYERNYAPDIEDVAAMHKISVNEVIKLHSNTTYTVGMIGFLPGFAYLSGLSPMLETPRKISPRKSVPAGSVGIAGAQTGIYSLETPGGWQIIGRTPLRMFDVDRPQPALLKAGDTVLFKQVSAEEFEVLKLSEV